MGARLTDHIWTVQEVLTYKIAPAPWIDPKQPRRSRKKVGSDSTEPKRPRGRPRKHPLPDPTVPKRPRGRPRKVACALPPVSGSVPLKPFHHSDNIFYK